LPASQANPTGISFFAFLVAACSDRLGFLFSAVLAFLAFLISLAALVVDFVLFSIVRNQINDNTSARASFANATWMVVAATAVLFLASFVVCFSCCAGRREKRYRGRGDYTAPGYAGEPQMAQPRGKWYSLDR
jgi:heme/copper-type cytochrome/quinol oxidase subunit 3